MKTQTPYEVIEAIHNEFDTATEALIQQALTMVVDSSKADRLKSLGFGLCKEVKSVNQNREIIEDGKRVSEKVAYFQKYYPNHKFITEKLVDKICEKYGLSHGKVSIYTGDVPEKNLREIEIFKLRKEDYTERKWSALDSFILTNQPTFGFLRNEWESSPLTGRGWGDYLQSTQQAMRGTSASRAEKIKPEFEICAPPKDFDMTNHKKVGNKIVPKDPIVLQPVDGGYLIVTKWGLEATDPDVANEKLN